jgi:steroid delta-isomerase-like uncharacterized protein
MSSTNKGLLGRYLDAYNRGAMDELAALVAIDYVHHASGRDLTIEQFKKGAAWMRAGLPDLRIEIEDMIEEGDQVAVRYVCRGTHLASLLGEAVTNDPVTVTGCTVFRFADGRIAEDWEVLDEAEMMRQIGASPS